MINIAIIGSRNIEDGVSFPSSKTERGQRNSKANLDFMVESVKRTLDLMNISIIEIDYIVSGGVTGADTLSEKAFEERGLSKRHKLHRARWHIYGNAAGMIRNKLIEEDADICFAFVDKPLKESKGTENTVGLFLKKNKAVCVSGLVL
jgi:hypothetical protein